MSYQEEKESVTNILGQYAQVLNTGEAALIPGFFTDDAYFLPEGVKSPLRPAQLVSSGNKYLKQHSFSIQYQINEVVIENDFAFVDARAITSEHLAGSKDLKIKKSIDFFTFRKSGKGWKIYRYIFNNVTEL